MATNTGAGIAIEFLPPGDPRRRPPDMSEVGRFAAGYAGQAAEAQQAEFGPAYDVDDQGFIRVPAEAVRGLFESGAFRRTPYPHHYQPPRPSLGMSDVQTGMHRARTTMYARTPFNAPLGGMRPSPHGHAYSTRVHR